MAAHRVVVVGAGVSGLAAGHCLARDAATVPGGVEVLVLERDPVVGGKARTIDDGGFQIETGPTSYLDNSEAFRALVASAGLDEERIAADPSAKKRYIVRHGRPRQVHAHPLKFATSGLLGPLGVLRIAAEPFVGRGDPQIDESVWDFARRRLGGQAADRLIAPMVLGVHAGDAKRLSLRSAFPRLAALEAEHGSLIRGAIARKRAGQGGDATGPSGTVSSFRGGLGALPLALAATPGLAIRTGAEVVGLERREAGWRVHVAGDGEPIPADAVVLAGEAWAMGGLLASVDAPAADALTGIPTPPVTVVALGFRQRDCATLPPGFGALVPRGEGLRLLGTLWDSQIFARRSPEGFVLVRALYGGAVDPDAARLDDQELTRLARDELRRLVGMTAPPELVRVIRWPRAIPQYEIGHERRVEAVERACETNPGLFVAGNALHGVAFAKAAECGVRAADAVRRYLT